MSGRKEEEMENPKEFLSPSSSLTPGYAGAMTMMITNTVASQFELEKPWPGRVGLIVSLLFGFMVITPLIAAYWQKVLYFLINSLIIFTVALGANTVGEKSGSRQQNASIENNSAPSRLLQFSSAYASQAPSPESQVGWCCLNNRINPSSQEECNKWGGLFFSTQEEASRSCQIQPPDTLPREENRFF
jgi:hypothetical protein